MHIPRAPMDFRYSFLHLFPQAIAKNRDSCVNIWAEQAASHFEGTYVILLPFWRAHRPHKFVTSWVRFALVRLPFRTSRLARIGLTTISQRQSAWHSSSAPDCLSIWKVGTSNKLGFSNNWHVVYLGAYRTLSRGQTATEIRGTWTMSGRSSTPPSSAHSLVTIKRSSALSMKSDTLYGKEIFMTAQQTVRCKSGACWVDTNSLRFLLAMLRVTLTHLGYIARVARIEIVRHRQLAPNLLPPKRTWVDFRPLLSLLLEGNLGLHRSAESILRASRRFNVLNVHGRTGMIVRRGQRLRWAKICPIQVGDMFAPIRSVDRSQPL